MIRAVEPLIALLKAEAVVTVTLEPPAPPVVPAPYPISELEGSAGVAPAGTANAAIENAYAAKDNPRTTKPIQTNFTFLISIPKIVILLEKFIMTAFIYDDIDHDIVLF